MKRFRTEDEGEVEGMDMAANLLALLSGVPGGDEPRDGPRHPVARLFRCKSCNRQFASFQALGGHRASHKKPRLAAAPLRVQAAAPPPKSRPHECPICGLDFAMGQALGGHMRRHRTVAGAFPLVEKKAGEKRPAAALSWGLDLDLNLPPSDMDGDFCTLRLGLGLPMVGCLY